jgi:drug/metabolite transporter (DMT)-like permease
MLNMETVATALIALAFFGERVSPSIWLAVSCMTVMGVLVTGTGGAGSASLAGAMLILGSCIAWGIETNVVTTLSSRNPLVVTLIECLPAAATLSLVAALRVGGPPPVRDLLLGVLLGSFSNGAGLLLYFASLRTMGAARTAAFAGVGPLAGALLSLVLFRTPVTWVVVAALVLTAAAILVVGRDDERRSLVRETAER